MTFFVYVRISSRQRGIIMIPPQVDKSTKLERENYIKENFKCISNCESCGICKVLRGKSPEVAYAEYIEGLKDFIEVAKQYR